MDFPRLHSCAKGEPAFVYELDRRMIYHQIPTCRSSHSLAGQTKSTPLFADFDAVADFSLSIAAKWWSLGQSIASTVHLVCSSTSLAINHEGSHATRPLKTSMEAFPQTTGQGYRGAGINGMPSNHSPLDGRTISVSQQC